MNDTTNQLPLVYKMAKTRWLKWSVLVVPLMFIILTLAVSMVGFLKRSVIGSDGFTLEYFQKIFTEPLYQQVLISTLRVGTIVTVLTALLAYPMAYLSVQAKSRRVRRFITGGVLIPYWISMLVRIFAWQILLQTNGVINQTLQFLGIIKEPIQLLYTGTAVIISLTHILLPYMFLSLQSNMEGIDSNLLFAAQSMGARPFRAFLDVFLPQSMPGVFSGCLMVFVLSLGFYIAPALLGGASDMMMSNLIETNMSGFQWNLAAALSVQLLVIVFILIGISFKLVGNVFLQKRA